MFKNEQEKALEYLDDLENVLRTEKCLRKCKLINNDNAINEITENFIKKYYYYNKKIMLIYGILKGVEKYLIDEFNNRYRLLLNKHEFSVCDETQINTLQRLLEGVVDFYEKIDKKLKIEIELTEEQKEYIVVLRKGRGCSWRRVAEEMKIKYPDMNIVSGHQIDGMELCRLAGLDQYKNKE